MHSEPAEVTRRHSARRRPSELFRERHRNAMRDKAMECSRKSGRVRRQSGASEMTLRVAGGGREPLHPCHAHEALTRSASSSPVGQRTQDMPVWRRLRQPRKEFHAARRQRHIRWLQIPMGNPKRCVCPPLGLSATVIGAARRALARARPRASARELDLWFVELHYGREVVAGLRADLERRDAGPLPDA
jgi:hypothetical protein